MVTLKLPTYPSDLITSAQVYMLIRGSLTAACAKSLIKSAAFSPVGYRLFRLEVCPPRNGDFSTRATSIPRRARSRAARSPATPPPMTVAWFAASTFIGSRACRCFDFEIAADTRPVALAVAFSPSCTQLTCSRMLACS